jgi:hypothetical protein
VNYVINNITASPSGTHYVLHTNPALGRQPPPIVLTCAYTGNCTIANATVYGFPFPLGCFEIEKSQTDFYQMEYGAPEYSTESLFFQII